MPFYEYQCQQCDHRLEVLQKISDEPLVYCPECNETSLKKLISAAAFRLKGTGWYETDFKNNDKKKEKTDSKATESPKSGETKLDNKNSPAKADTSSAPAKPAASSTASA